MYLIVNGKCFKLVANSLYIMLKRIIGLPDKPLKLLNLLTVSSVKALRFSTDKQFYVVLRIEKISVYLGITRFNLL